MEYNIRSYQQEDFECLVCLTYQLQNYFSKIDSDDNHIPFRSNENAARYILKALDDSSEMDGTVLVAESSDGDIIGFIQGVVLDRSISNTFFDLTHKNKNREGAIGLLIVNEQYRGNGIATCLIEKITDYFRKKNCVNISLIVSPFNAPAIKLYKKHGFEICELKMKYKGSVANISLE